LQAISHFISPYLICFVFQNLKGSSFISYYHMIILFFLICNIIFLFKPAQQ
jgi:hypothetical protein